MLSISKMSGAGQGDYYLGLAAEDYYLSGGEPPGQWYGLGALSLRLSGPVQREVLQNLLLGKSPDGSRPLVQNAGNPKRLSGHDLTWSAPKSVSVLWAMSSPEVRRKIEKAHNDAVQATLGWLEKKAIRTRRGHQGSSQERVGMIAALFEHGTSRALDPLLHTHALVLNLCVRNDGSTGTIISLLFYKLKMASGRQYREELAKILERDVGVEIIWGPKGLFEVAGIPKPVCLVFSKRRVAVKALLQKWGVNTAEAAKAAVLVTRKPKVVVRRSELFLYWEAVGQKLGFGTKEVAALLQAAVERRLQSVTSTAAATETGNRSQATLAQPKLVRDAVQDLGTTARLVDSPKLPPSSRVKQSPPSALDSGNRASANEPLKAAPKKDLSPPVSSAAENRHEADQTIAAPVPKLTRVPAESDRRRTGFERESAFDQSNAIPHRHESGRAEAIRGNPRSDSLPQPPARIEDRVTTGRTATVTLADEHPRTIKSTTGLPTVEPIQRADPATANAGPQNPVVVDSILADRKQVSSPHLRSVIEMQPASSRVVATSAQRLAELPAISAPAPKAIGTVGNPELPTRIPTPQKTGIAGLLPVNPLADPHPSPPSGSKIGQARDQAAPATIPKPSYRPLQPVVRLSTPESVGNPFPAKAVSRRQSVLGEFPKWGMKLRNYGRVLFRIPFIRVEIRVVQERVFWKAPKWSPVRNLALPRFAVAIAGNPVWEVPKLRYSGPIRRLGPFSVQNQRLFPKAPAWSPASRIALPVLNIRPSLDVLSAARIRISPRSKSGRPKPLTNELSR